MIILYVFVLFCQYVYVFLFIYTKVDNANAYLKPLKDKFAPYNEYDLTKSLWYLDCYNKTVAIKNDTRYLQNDVIYSYKPSTLTFDDIVPDSHAEDVYTIICPAAVYQKK